MASSGRLCTRFHDADQPRASDAEIAWYVSRLPKNPGPSLEAMSGSGRLLIPLLQQRQNVHGVDLSPAMIASCEARLSANGLATPVFKQDIGTLHPPVR